MHWTVMDEDFSAILIRRGRGIAARGILRKYSRIVLKDSAFVLATKRLRVIELR